MGRTFLLVMAALAFLAALAFYGLTRPVVIAADSLPDHTPDLANGRSMFFAGGCANCHAVPVKGCGDLDVVDKTHLAGGRCLKSDVGTFYAPNISPDK